MRTNHGSSVSNVTAKTAARFAFAAGISLLLSRAIFAGAVFHGANVPQGTIMVHSFDDNGHFAYSVWILSGADMGNMGNDLSVNFLPATSNQGALSQNLSVPGYHHVKYAGLETEIAATCRTAHCRFTISSGSSFSVSLRPSNASFTQPDQFTVRCTTSFAGGHPVCLIYKFKQAIQSRSGSTVQIQTSGQTSIEMKVSESLFDFPHAEQSLAAEDPGWDFDLIRTGAQNQWNAAFGRLAVEGTDAVKNEFYANLFLVLAHENVMSETDGSYKYSPSGTWDKTQWVNGTAAGYTHYGNVSGWDIWRSWNQLMGFVYTDRANDMAQSLVVDGTHQADHRLPIWTVWTRETSVMASCGLAGPNMVANFHAFGATGFAGKSQAFALMLRDTTEYLNRYGGGSANGSNVVESAASLFCIAQYAARTGDTAVYRRVMKMAGRWENYYNASGIAGGGGCEDPLSIYSWMIPWNMAGLIQKMGGATAAEASMDAVQETSMGNEPEMHLPFVYNWIGKPWKTQKAVHDMHLDGSDDLGALSSWKVWCMMGIYPAIYAIPGFTIHAPAVTKATITFGKGAGRKLCIIGQNASTANYYVQSVTLNGSPWTSTWLPISALTLDSNTLAINCGSQPSTWGSRPQDAPPSFDENSAPTALVMAVPQKQSIARMALNVRAGHSLDIAIANAGPHEIRMYGANGSMVWSMRGVGERRYSISRSFLSADFYIVKAVTGQGRMARVIAMPR